MDRIKHVNKDVNLPKSVKAQDFQIVWASLTKLLCFPYFVSVRASAGDASIPLPPFSFEGHYSLPLEEVPSSEAHIMQPIQFKMQD